MPLREFKHCSDYREIYHPSTDSSKVPSPTCRDCGGEMEMMISRFKIDTSVGFEAFKDGWTGPDGRKWSIDNLHQLRKVEKEYEKTGHNVRFDAYSAEPSNPDPIDGYGLEYWDGDKSNTGGKVHVDTKVKEAYNDKVTSSPSQDS